MWEVPKVGEGTSHIEYQIRRDNWYSMREVPKVGEGTSHIEYQIRMRQPVFDVGGLGRVE